MCIKLNNSAKISCIYFLTFCSSVTGALQRSTSSSHDQTENEACVSAIVDLGNIFWNVCFKVTIHWKDNIISLDYLCVESVNQIEQTYWTFVVFGWIVFLKIGYVCKYWSGQSRFLFVCQIDFYIRIALFTRLCI